MKFTISYLILGFCIVLNLPAQREALSNKIELSDQWQGTHFMPYAKGNLTLDVAGTRNPFQSDYSQKDARLLLEKLIKTVEILERSKLLSPPQGVDVNIQVSNLISSSLLNLNPHLKSFIEIGFFTLVAGMDGQPVRIPETNTWTHIWFNNPDRLVNSQAIVADIYVIPDQVNEFMGYPAYLIRDSESVIIHKSGIPLWIPVTNEECLLKMIEHAQNEIEKERLNFDTDGGDTSISNTIAAGKSQRKQDFEQAYEIVKGIDPEAAEEMKKSFEEVELTLLESANDPDLNISPNQISNMAIDEWVNIKRQLEGELQQFSFEQRRSLAYWAPTGDENKVSGKIFGYWSTHETGSVQLVKINPALIDIKRPESDIQLIVIEWTGALPTYDGMVKDGYHLQEWKQVEFSKDRDAWGHIVNMVE
jgi:hypothetical protein